MYRLRGNDVYFPLLIALLKVSRIFPTWFRRALIRAISLTAYKMSGRKRRSTIRAIDAAFGADLNANRKRDITRGAFYQFWLETFLMAPSSAEIQTLESLSLR